MFLHAALLRLKHPVSGEMLELTAPLPPELASFVASVDVTQKRDFG
jgi:23S rRNA pseudouridine955/2504/2580 synthase